MVGEVQGTSQKAVVASEAAKAAKIPHKLIFTRNDKGTATAEFFSDGKKVALSSGIGAWDDATPWKGGEYVTTRRVDDNGNISDLVGPTWRFEEKSIDHRSGILLHGGSRPDHSHGCLLLSTADLQIIAGKVGKGSLVIDVKDALPINPVKISISLDQSTSVFSEGAVIPLKISLSKETQ